MLIIPRDEETVKPGWIIRPVFDPEEDTFVLAAWPANGGDPKPLAVTTLDWLYEQDKTKGALLRQGAQVSSSCAEMCHV